ncbi:hypothetical protein NDU88_012612 [Pleurodeles waltl]|uniref:Uncharacterized protein n=1 Tax=Pleurodeles waltl TaxID=8319 RepID=A0AAV7R4B5_PLEWA|nr:hypothetical protein NDU88_012612 [Pleurodeles waltl]
MPTIHRSSWSREELRQEKESGRENDRTAENLERLGIVPEESRTMQGVKTHQEGVSPGEQGGSPAARVMEETSQAGAWTLLHAADPPLSCSLSAVSADTSSVAEK